MLVPKTICGGVWASPGQYSTPRVEALPDGSWNAQTSLPVVGSSATTRLYGVLMYITPLTTMGVVSLAAKPEPPRPRPRPAAGAAPPAPAAPAPVAAGRMWYTHATCIWLTLAGVICVSGENRMPPGSWP